jgi:hypothetical protein
LYFVIVLLSPIIQAHHHEFRNSLNLSATQGNTHTNPDMYRSFGINSF